MKHKAVIVVAIVLISVTMLAAQESPMHSQPKDKHIARALKNILAGLHSQNDGVIECTCMLISKIKMKYPDKIFPEILSVVDSLSLSHPSNVMRYKAYLASSISSDPEWFAMDARVVTAGREKFFMLAAQRLNQKMFGLSSL